MERSIADLTIALKEWSLWLRWAWYDIKLRYRRSYIGPFWITLSLAITITGMSFVFGAVFQTGTASIMPYIAAGMLVWLTISGIVVEGCGVFVASSGIIKEVSLPLTVHTLRLITRTGIIMLHHLVIMVIIIPLFGVPVTWATLMVFPGLVLYALNAFWIVQLLGTVASRFRDIQQVMQAVMQLALFVTPVFWQAELVAGKRQFIVDWNVFAHMIDVVRKPLLGEMPSMLNYTVVCSVTAIGLLAAMLVFGLFSRRIVYWL